MQYKVIILELFCLLFMGCASMKPYDAAMRNVGKQDMKKAKMMIGDHELSVGWLVSGQRSIHLKPGPKLSEYADIYWQRVDGESYHQRVELKSRLSVLGSQEWYEITFEVNDDNQVDVKVLICHDNGVRELCS